MSARKVVGGLLALGLLGVGGVEAAWQIGLGKLSDHGVRWVDADWGLTERTLYGVDRGALSAERVVLRRDGVVVHGGVVALDGASGSGAAGGTSASGLPELPVPVEVVDLQVVASDQVLATLSGAIDAQGGELVGDGARVEVPGPMGERAVATLTVPVDHERLSGTLAVRVAWADPPRVELSSSDLVVSHPLLSTKPMALPALEAELVGDVRTEPLTGPFSLGDCSGELSIERGDELTLGVTLVEQDAGDVLGVFADIVPELRWAHIDGVIEGSATYAHPSGAWTLEPSVRDLTVSGAVSDLGSLRGGRFTYAVTSADGQRSPRVTGEGTRDWVPSHQVSPHLFAAIVAAEDSTFHDHDGYSEASIREALTANVEAGAVVRGGSTLTQQLAKNLFLDGERTVERKLRELVLAVELDRALGKRRVLELYVNIVEWGPDMWGVAAASDRYFLRPAETLPPNEAAFLAAVLPNPREMYSDWYLRDRASSVRIDWILQNMADGGHFSDADARAWAATPLRFVPPPR